MRSRISLIVGVLCVPALLSGCGASSSAASSSPACSITADDVEVHLSSGGVTCTDAARELASVGSFQPGGLTGTNGIPDTPQVDCTLDMNGQTATISYGSTLGLASEAQQACSALVTAGWSQQ
jgi:hypothetical protein